MNLEKTEIKLSTKNTNTNFTTIKNRRNKFLLLALIMGLLLLSCSAGVIYWINAQSKSSILSISPSLKNLNAQSNIPCNTTTLKPTQKVCADLLHTLRDQTKEQIALYQITIVEVISQKYNPCDHLGPNMGMCAPGDHSVPGFQITLSYGGKKYIYDTDTKNALFYHLDNPNPTPTYVQNQKNSDGGSMTISTNFSAYDWILLDKYNLQFRVPHAGVYGAITTKYFNDNSGQFSMYYLFSSSFVNKTSHCSTADKFKGVIATIVPAESENAARTAAGDEKDFNAIGWTKLRDQYYHIESNGRCYRDQISRKFADLIADEFTQTARSIR